MKNIRYNIKISVDFKSFSFSGDETISFDFYSGEKMIYPDSVDLTIEDVSLNGEKIGFNVKDNKIFLEKKYANGNNSLRIKFKGKLRDDLTGFYLSRYIEKEKEEYLATTHFEPVDARKAFPCFDKPDKKAKFKISLIIPRRLKAISNTLPECEKYIDKNTKIVSFKETPLMSTYLVYIGVGDFEFLEDSYNDVLIRIAATRGRSGAGKKALFFCKKSLKFLEDYFGIKYPLEKLDLISIPDFSAGAMENWGAITFRENLLLYFKDKSSKVTEQRIAMVLSHELVHQWFGNLVTMKWWDDLWLNESFATFMAYKTIDSYKKEWDVWSDYLLYETFGGKEFDCKKTSHPIRVKIKNESEIEGIFDEISYNKGGSILRYIEYFIGEEKFKIALSGYLKSFQYSNASSEDLWNCFEEHCKGSKEVINSLIEKTGIPEITSICKNKNSFLLSQKRFLLIGEDDNTIWSLPVLVRSKRQEKFILKEKESVFNFSNPPIYFNYNASCFYIVNEIFGKKRFEKLNHLEKLSYINDLYLKFKKGDITNKEFIYNIEENIKSEKKPVVLGYAGSLMFNLYLILEKYHFKDVAMDISNRIIEILGRNPRRSDSFLDTIARKTALLQLGIFGSKSIVNFANNLFDKYLSGGKLHPDLKSFVFPVVISNDSSKYDIIFDLYKRSDTQEEKTYLMQSFLFCNDILKIENIFNIAKDNKIIKYGMIHYLFNPAIFISRLKKYYILYWLIENWDYYSKNVMIADKVLSSTFPICGLVDKEKAISFLKLNDSLKFRKLFKELKEDLQINLNILSRNC